MNDKIPKNGKLRAFLDEFALAFDLTGGVKLPDYSNGFEYDREALAGDWLRIGNDLRKAMDQVAGER
jgi:hypothetical protein